MIIEKCSDVEVEIKKTKERNCKINLLIIRGGKKWCHIVSLDPFLNRIIKKLRGRLTWKRENASCFYVYQTTKEFIASLKNREYLASH